MVCGQMQVARHRSVDQRINDISRKSPKPPYLWAIQRA
jgi:hypothetical protein